MEKIGDVLREKVLILEDMPLQRNITADTLARAGYATVEVETTAKAFALIGAESPDLIILDSRTPDTEGARVCRRLKGNPFTNHIPILLFSNQRLAEQFTVLETGADDYLGKPFSPAELLAHVKALLAQSVQYDPITKLPSGSYLHKQLDTRLSQNQPTAVAYIDVDHFRPYKYAYGEAAAEHALVQVGKLIVDLLPARNSFAGNLGSDDFLAVMPPQGSETVVQTLLDNFKLLRKEFFNERDLARGYTEPPDLEGNLRWRLMTLSAALVSNDRQVLVSFVQLSELLDQVMASIKSEGGNGWRRDRRAGMTAGEL